MNVKEIAQFLRSATKAEAMEVNRFAVGRMNLLHSEEQRKAAGQFSVGDKVSFESRKGYTVRGTITKVNMVTAELKAEDGVRWKVSPGMLKKVMS